MSYLASISVDKAQGVIAHVQADHADGKDSQFLISIVDSLQKRFKTYDLSLKKVVADAGYSSGENYQYLENRGITPTFLFMDNSLLSGKALATMSKKIILSAHKERD
jgi:cation transport regulator ChaC